MHNLPDHLKKYVVTQNYEKYTPIDQACWRYVLRQLKDFFAVHAHESYLNGLVKTGITEDEIPRIEVVSQHLEKYGWRAIPVSGFIPPAAFMELQSLSVLPIASDMRTLEHIAYTPAPDIVHEAAGHAPIIVEPEYSAYLKAYAQVSKKAIISKEDLEIYEAIRHLSDLKENPNSTADEIKKAEQHLDQTVKSTSHVSEASELSRMNWWTAEYGLIGSIENPKIYGAGLLSSMGESRECLKPHVKKIPLSVDCIKQTYDITEPQPQLFVTPDFKTLVSVLNEMAETMAYKVGGQQGLDKAIQAQSINTIEFENNIQLSGVVSRYITNSDHKIIFVQLSGPSQISFQDKELLGHDNSYHQHGYSTPIGPFTTEGELKLNSPVTFTYASGFKVSGVLQNIKFLNTSNENKTETKTLTEFESKNLNSHSCAVISLTHAAATYQNEILFKPEWGVYDIVTANTVMSVFGGPADRLAYGETEDFVAARVPQINYTDHEKQIFSLYSEIKSIRASLKENKITENIFIERVTTLLKVAYEKASDQWLLFLEIFEVLFMFEAKYKKTHEDLNYKVTNQLEILKRQSSKNEELINNGIRLLYD